jgi:hypothetical protein
MKSKYKIIDNFLDKEIFNIVYDKMVITRTSFFPWYYAPGVSNYSYEKNSKIFYFVHNFYIEDRINSEFFSDIILPIINKFNKLHKTKDGVPEIKSLIRAKGNFYPYQGEKRFIHGAHKDYPFKHKGFLFYVNDNNGSTILEDGTEIESKANRVLIFEPYKSHQSTNCSDKQGRININFNYF